MKKKNDLRKIKSQRKLSLAGLMIMGSYEKENFERLLRSIDGYVEILFVHFNHGSLGLIPEEEFPIIPDDVSLKVIFQRYTWDDDFAKARNENLEMLYNYQNLSGKKFDWWIWLDQDDTIENPEDLPTLIESLDENTQMVFLPYHYGVDPKTEQVIAIQQRERLFRTDCKVKWSYPIHEVAHSPISTQAARKKDVIIRHWREPHNVRTETRERNRRILTRARKQDPDNPRLIYYLANEIYAEAALCKQEGKPFMEYINAATKLYEEYIPNAPSPDDAYIAYHQMGELARMAGAFPKAIEAELGSLIIHPDWPDAYCGIAESFMNMEDWDKVEWWANAALVNCTGEQTTTQIREPLHTEYIPRLLLGIAQENKGDYEKALEQYELIADKGLSVDVDEKLKNVKKLLTQQQLKAQEVSPDEQKKLIRKRLFSSNPDKSIAFFTRPLFEPWHPEIVKDGGIGGAETCVMEIAKRFAQDGWRSVVFGTPGPYRGTVDSDGVEWWSSEDFLTTEKFTVLVSSRTPELFDANINAKLKLLWMHDVNTGPNFEGEFGDRLANVDYVVGLTNWHCQHLNYMYGVEPHKLACIPNGIDLSRFDDWATTPKQPHKFVWSSSPDRGIDVLINMWPSIRKRWSDAELHVFYGWHSIEKILEIQPDHPIHTFYENVNAVLDELGREEAGIFWHDRVDQNTLAKELMTCQAWLYPTYFMETFCITALEMQAAGVIPITSNLAGLREVVSVDDLKIDGWPNNSSFARQFVNKTSQVVNSMPWYQNKLIEQGREFSEQFTWDNSYQIWSSVVNNVLNPVSV